MSRPIDIVLSLMDDAVDHQRVIKYAWDENIEEFWVGLDLATSQYNFQITKVPSLDLEDLEPGSLTFEEFFTLAMRLASGTLTGLEANQAIENIALKANAKEWNFWYRRILLKSLSKFIPIEVIKNELIRLTSE